MNTWSNLGMKVYIGIKAWLLCGPFTTSFYVLVSFGCVEKWISLGTDNNLPCNYIGNVLDGYGGRQISPFADIYWKHIWDVVFLVLISRKILADRCFK